MKTATGLQLKSLVIELCEMTCDRMTGENIRLAIVDYFAAFGITENDLLNHTAFITDRGSNMLMAVRDFQSHACLAHLWNSVVGAILDMPEAKKIKANDSSLVRYIKKNHIASQLNTKLKSHVETRWNSAHDMMVSIIDNYQELYHLLQTKQESLSRTLDVLDKLTCLPLNNMKAMCQLLSFFELVTAAVEGDKKVTLTHYWPTLCEMKQILMPNRSDTELV